MITRCVDVFNPFNPPIHLLMIENTVTLVQVPTANFLFHGSLMTHLSWVTCKFMNQPLFDRLFSLASWRGKDTTSITNAGGFLRNDLLVRILIALVKLLGSFAFDI